MKIYKPATLFHRLYSPKMANLFDLMIYAPQVANNESAAIYEKIT